MGRKRGKPLQEDEGDGGPKMKKLGDNTRFYTRVRTRKSR